MAENIKGKNLLLEEPQKYIIFSCALSKNLLLYFYKQVLNLKNYMQ